MCYFTNGFKLDKLLVQDMTACTSLCNWPVNNCYIFILVLYYAPFALLLSVTKLKIIFKWLCNALLKIIYRDCLLFINLPADLLCWIHLWNILHHLILQLYWRSPPKLWRLPECKFNVYKFPQSTVSRTHMSVKSCVLYTSVLLVL